ncbi:MAG: DUF1343 domain-containing protein [Bdellovibrionaceae bacterium]|nr:DUF1343 domain-containing protein [Bdellovibrio sp.]
MKLGLEVLLENKKLIQELKKQRVALVCHPASVDQNLQHSFDLLHKAIGLSAAFGPQHGVKGEKQDNMIESDDALHPEYQIPIFSLYGKVRRPTPEMMQTFDVIIFDLQDLGCRIYTFITTLLYVMEECAKQGKTVIVLDRPNPAGREIEGHTLIKGYESFVGAGPFPMRHGLTPAEMAQFYKTHFNLGIDLKIIKMKDYKPNKKPGYGWSEERPWVNPSPNAPTLNMARFYPGTVIIEGTTLSEGRGTTRALEQVGASDIDFKKVLTLMKKKAPQWMKGALIRECFFEPTFHKHEKKLCHGFQVHTDTPQYKPAQFKPYRLMALMLRCVRELYPQYEIWRDFAYEYTEGKLPVDVITGGPHFREWVDDPNSKPQQLEKVLKKDEAAWMKQSKKYLLYR